MIESPPNPCLDVKVGIVATASYLPQKWMSAADLFYASGIPEEVFVKRFGLLGKHIAGEEEHVTDMALLAANKLLTENGVDPLSIDAVIYFGSTWKNYPVWQAAPKIAHELGCYRAFGLELDYVSCGSLVALRVAKAMAASDPTLHNLLLVGASRESELLDYTNNDSRFMFNFGDGAVAALVTRGHSTNRILETVMITDGSLSRHVKVPAGGSVAPASIETVTHRQHYLQVEDPSTMRVRLNAVSLSNFVEVSKTALLNSGVQLSDIAFVCPIHMKRSMNDALLEALDCDAAHSIYLEDTGHMSGVDNLLALDRLARSGRLAEGDLVLLVAAGTGYTWAASVVQWGSVHR